MMLGAAEFTFIGNVLMGVMAICGVVGMIYGLGSYMTNMGRSELRNVEGSETHHKRAA
jgi:hypothetical protein